MDVRHEPFQQVILNQIITVVNQYIKNNTDDLLLDDEFKKNIEKICDYIYFYSKMTVDVAGILSRYNLLSIDVVLFPAIRDVENQIAMDENFEKLISLINPILQQKNKSAQTDSSAKLYQQINQIIERANEQEVEIIPKHRF